MRIDGLGHSCTSACRHTGAWALACACALLAWPAAVPAQDGSKPVAGIYTCVDAKGRRHTGDRPITECLDREQRILNADGSLKGVHQPSMTAEERAEREARERKAAEERAAIADAGRRDRNLMKRYPDERSHQRAREAAVDTVRMAIRASEQRLRELAAERRPLQNEAEFYAGRQLPPKLKQQLDANEAATEAQRALSANQEAELGRVTRSFDAELERLRRLWAGAVPGSMGPLVMPSGPASAPAASAAARRPPVN